LDGAETGGHVRPGYTYATYKKLLEPIGFQVSAPIGIGGPIRHFCNERITWVQQIGGLLLGLPVFAVLNPLSLLDTRAPSKPFSLYVRATKPTTDDLTLSATI
jgi:hypothetical protein